MTAGHYTRASPKMITYNKIGWGLPLLFRMYGSAFPRSFPFAALRAALTALFYLTIQTPDEGWWRHPYPYQIFAYIVGFIVIFRSNFGYQRYWDGRSWLQNMTAAWVDACVQAGAFHEADTDQLILLPGSKHYFLWGHCCS